MVQTEFLTPLQQKLFKAYQQLSAKQQQVLQMFAIAYAPIARSKMLDALSHAGIMDENGDRFSNSRLRGHIEYLLSVELLIQGRTTGPQCHPQIAEIITRETVEQGQFKEMAETISTISPISQPNGRNFPRRFETNEHFLREFRIALYGDRFDLVEELVTEYYDDNYFSRHLDKLAMKDIVLTVFNNPFDPQWFAQLPQTWHDDSLATILTEAELALLSATAPSQYLCNLYNQSQPDHRKILNNGEGNAADNKAGNPSSSGEKTLPDPTSDTLKNDTPKNNTPKNNTPKTIRPEMEPKQW